MVMIFKALMPYNARSGVCMGFIYWFFDRMALDDDMI